jgi:hypothetical protein
VVVLRPAGALLTPAAAHAYQTLPAMFAEALGGGHVAYAWDPRGHVAGTAYAAHVADLVNGVALGTQESARWPGGERFGAVGLAAAYGRGGLDLAAEVARSFDELPRAPGLAAGDGLGAVARLALSRRDEEAMAAGGAPIGVGSELEVTARYYQATFVNPYARPVAAPDEREGQRARDEAGVRVRAAATWPRAALRAAVDGWAAPSVGAPRLASDLRLELAPSARWRGGLALGFDEAFGEVLGAGAAEVFGAGAGEGTEGASEASAPGSWRLLGRGRVTFAPGPGLELTAQVQHELVDDEAASARRLTLWLLGRWRSASGAHLRVQLRHRAEAAGQGGAHLEIGRAHV